MDEAIIVVSIISSIGMLAGIQLLNHNWFKKEAWKFKRDQTKKIDAIKLKKLERDIVGVKVGGTGGKTPLQGNMDIGNILNLAKNLDPETLQSIVSGLAGNEETGDGGTIETILNNLPPEIIENFLKGIAKGKAETENKDLVFES